MNFESDVQNLETSHILVTIWSPVPKIRNAKTIKF